MIPGTGSYACLYQGRERAVAPQQAIQNSENNVGVMIQMGIYLNQTEDPTIGVMMLDTKFPRITGDNGTPNFLALFQEEICSSTCIRYCHVHEFDP